jgi:hypothetical protein
MVLPSRYWPEPLVEWWEDGTEATPQPPRWLASFVGAIHNGERADFVVDADQFLILYGTYAPAAAADRLAELRSADRAALLAADPGNYSVPVASVARVTMSKLGRLTKQEKVPGTVRIFTTDGTEHEIRLNSVALMRQARATLSKLLGTRFES